ncbi:hypothetical protein L211DRAFT_592859 [Terfezia boudieri ATCC MYA-4762]|uniref:Uncharacterized protein n=1 Tax=Terfezia boudieri ATCC MYA-4762 TaxID=1051890 RepID=A0A3N4LNX9_9PEZI|nr:hypothetical protein L211DRAFT_592859 [Terfezia boudieri ATCC MYA-4762]
MEVPPLLSLALGPLSLCYALTYFVLFANRLCQSHICCCLFQLGGKEREWGNERERVQKEEQTHARKEAVEKKIQEEQRTRGELQTQALIPFIRHRPSSRGGRGFQTAVNEMLTRAVSTYARGNCKRAGASRLWEQGESGRTGPRLGYVEDGKVHIELERVLWMCRNTLAVLPRRESDGQTLRTGKQPETALMFGFC